MTLARRITGLARGGGGGVAPDDIAGLVAWYDFGEAATLFTDTSRTSPVASDGDAIAGVEDLSGAGNHLLQSTGGSRPAYKTSILNSLDAALFDGGDSLQISTSPDYTQPNTVVLVAKHGDGADGKHFFDGSGSGRQLIGTFSGHWIIYAGGSIISGSATPDTNNNVFVAQFNGASSKLWVNGGSADAAGNAGSHHLGAGVAGGMHLGSDETGSANLPNGSYLYAVFVYNAALSLSDINALGSYINGRWGLTWTTAT